MKKEVNVEKLIKEFTDMANRESLLSNASQGDLLMQITGTIAKVAMESDDSMDKYRRGVPVYEYSGSVPTIALPAAIYDKYKDSGFEELFIKSGDFTITGIRGTAWQVTRLPDYIDNVVVTSPGLQSAFGGGAVLMSTEWLKDKAKTAVRITETLTRTVLVDTDYENAEDIVADAYYKGVVMLTPDNSTVEVYIEDDTKNYKDLFGDDIFDYLEVSEEFKDKKE